MISSFLLRIYNALSKTMDNSKHLDLKQILKHHYLNLQCFLFQTKQNLAIIGFELSSKISVKIIYQEKAFLCQNSSLPERLRQYFLSFYLLGRVKTFRASHSEMFIVQNKTDVNLCLQGLAHWCTKISFD